jgi:hypothetical protein
MRAIRGKSFWFLCKVDSNLPLAKTTHREGRKGLFSEIPTLSVLCGLSFALFASFAVKLTAVEICAANAAEPISRFSRNQDLKSSPQRLPAQPRDRVLRKRKAMAEEKSGIICFTRRLE